MRFLKTLFSRSTNTSRRSLSKLAEKPPLQNNRTDHIVAFSSDQAVDGKAVNLSEMTR